MEVAAPAPAPFTPDRINPLVMEFAVMDWQQTRSFYIETLGFTLQYARPDEGFAFVSLGAAQIMFYQLNLKRNIVPAEVELSKPFGCGVNVQITVDDVERLYRRVTENAVAVVLPIETRCYTVEAAPLVVR